MKVHNMIRRTVILSLPALALSALAVTAADDPLAVAFGALDASDRRAVQEQVAMAGFYNGTIDGAYGPRTRQALIEAAAYIQYNSYDKVSFDLTTAEGSAKYLEALAGGELEKYLWGEGDESEGG